MVGDEKHEYYVSTKGLKKWIWNSNQIKRDKHMAEKKEIKGEEIKWNTKKYNTVLKCNKEKSIPLTHKYTIANFPGLIQARQKKMAELS